MQEVMEGGSLQQMVLKAMTSQVSWGGAGWDKRMQCAYSAGAQAGQHACGAGAAQSPLAVQHLKLNHSML